MAAHTLLKKLTKEKGSLPPNSTTSRLFADKPVLVECTIRFAIGFILSGAQIFSGLSPFGAAFIAAGGAAPGMLASGLGAMAGYFLSLPLNLAAKYICISVIVLAAALALRNKPLMGRQWLMPLLVFVATACVDVIPTLSVGWSSASTARFLSDTVLSGGCAYFYKKALTSWSGRFSLDQQDELIHTVSILILLSTLLMSAAQFTILGVISVGRSLAVLLVLLAAFKGGVGLGSTTGLALGLAMDAASGGTPLFCTAYGLAGMVAGIFSKRHRVVFALAYILVDGIVAGVSLGSTGVPAILYEVFIASVLFMVLPASFMARLSVLLPGVTAGHGTARALAYTKNRVDLTALAFRDLYETVKTATGSGLNDSDIAQLFDRAAEKTCLPCLNAAQCWNKNYTATVDAMNNATSLMLRRGALVEEDFAESFKRSCVHLDSYTAAVNLELKGLLYRQQYKKRLRDNQSAAFNQYADISAILSGISEDLDSSICGEAALENRLRKYLRSQNLPGDAAVFRDRGGRLHTEILGLQQSALQKLPGYLDKLSAAVNVRLSPAAETEDAHRVVLLEAEPLCVSVGISCKKRSEKEQSGDRGTYFKTDEGLFYVLLSDGMGTGAEAARYSADAVRILERFLRAGVAPEPAVRLLNDLMLLKNEDDTGCATVDLISMSLFTGAARLYKYGAAPSYLRQGGAVRRLRGKSLAAGLGIPPHDAPDRLKMELKAGAVAVIVSDGVTGGADDTWLCDLLLRFEGLDPKALSTAIIDAACDTVGTEDDMTVICLFVDSRS